MLDTSALLIVTSWQDVLDTCQSFLKDSCLLVYSKLVGLYCTEHLTTLDSKLSKSKRKKFNNELRSDCDNWNGPLQHTQMAETTMFNPYFVSNIWVCCNGPFQLPESDLLIIGILLDLLSFESKILIYGRVYSYLSLSLRGSFVG